jgi:GNAT superfamily N-acetyltransferase
MTDSRTFQDFKLTYLKRTEIALAVEAYLDMVAEIKQFGSPILPTGKTSDFVYELLQSQYDAGNVCYAAYHGDDPFPIAYSLVFENRSVDLEYRIFHGLGLYIEPEFRKKGLGTEMIRYTLDDLKRKGIKKFIANFTSRESSSKIIKEFDFEPLHGNVCKNFF